MKTIRVLIMLLSLVLIATFFLPYLALTEESKGLADLGNSVEAVSRTSSREYTLLYSEMRDGSLSAFDIFRWTIAAVRGEAGSTVSFVIMVLFAGGIGILSLLVFLCGLSKKPILLFLLSVGMATYELKVFRGFYTNYFSRQTFELGIATTIYPILSATLAVLAIVMLIVKRGPKKQAG